VGGCRLCRWRRGDAGVAPTGEGWRPGGRGEACLAPTGKRPPRSGRRLRRPYLLAGCGAKPKTMQKSLSTKRRSLRLKDFDYRQGGAYFITVCTAGRASLFGKIRRGEMECNDYGRIVMGCWAEIPQHFPGVESDVFMVMPNHVHGIIMIVEGVGATQASPLRGGDLVMGARHASPPQPHTQGGGPAGPRPRSLGAIVGAFKSASTRKIRISSGERQLSVWQRNYYEHVIRDEKSLDRIREYIITNPARWELDRENPQARGKDDFDRWLDSFKQPPVGGRYAPPSR